MVKVRSVPRASVRVKTSESGVIVNEPITVKYVEMPQSIDALADVDASNESDGAVLVFDEDTGKYVAQQLDELVPGALDGGNF